MTRIVITTFGSTGDLNPFIAIALGLRARGHAVTFAVEGNLLPPLAALGFATRTLPGDMDAVYARHAAQFFGGVFPARLIQYFVRELILPNIHAQIAILREACADADLFISSTLQFPASIVADLVAIPRINVALNAGTVYSSAYMPLPMAAPPPPLRVPFNRLMWEMGKPLFRAILDRPLNRVRRELGLPPRFDLMYGRFQRADRLAVLVSPAFVPRPADWPSWVVETGFCFWDASDGWQAPPALAAFLDGARPVVALSFGSMTHATRAIFAPLYRAGLAAIHQVGARALLIGVDPATLPDPLPLATLCLPYAPFSRLYPRCAAVIHHGGIGTVAQALRAGVPSLIVPWGADQFFDGAQLQQLGAGRTVSQRHFTTERATRELFALLGDARYRQRAQTIARHLAREDGTAAFCDLVETVLGQPSH